MIRIPELQSDEFLICQCERCQRQRRGYAQLAKELQELEHRPTDTAPHPEPLVHGGAGIIVAALAVFSLVMVIGSVYGFILFVRGVL